MLRMSNKLRCFLRSPIAITLLFGSLLLLSGCTNSESPQSDSGVAVELPVESNAADEQATAAAENPISSADSVPVANMEGEWHLFRGDANSRGVATSGLPKNLDLIWQYEIERGSFEGTPIIVGDPKPLAIIGDADGKLIAFDLKSGDVKWEYKSGEIGFVTAPAYRDGKIYIGDMDGKFHCVDLNGKLLWDFQTDDSIDSSANFHEDFVLFGSRDARLYALYAEDGKLAWAMETDDQVRCSISVVEGRAFVAGCDGALHIINVKDGTEIDKVVIESPTCVTPAAADGQIFVGTENAGYFGIDWKNALINWQFGQDGSISSRSSPAVKDNHVVFGARNRKVYSVDPQTGSENWATELKSDIDSSPVIVGDRVFIGSTDGRLYALELKTGNIVWQREFNGQFIGSPAVGFGRLVIATNRGVVYCLGTAE